MPPIIIVGNIRIKKDNKNLSAERKKNPPSPPLIKGGKGRLYSLIYNHSENEIRVGNKIAYNPINISRIAYTFKGFPLLSMSLPKMYPPIPSPAMNTVRTVLIAKEDTPNTRES